jgi:hypothetical protein
MTFQEQVKALPEAERVKFFRSIMAVVDAGHATGVPPKEWANFYVAVCKQIKEHNK